MVLGHRKMMIVPEHGEIHSWGGQILPLAKCSENTLLDV